MSLGHSLWEIVIIISPTVRGATEVLKDLLRRSAFVWGVNAITPSVCRVAILEVSWCLLPGFSCWKNFLLELRRSDITLSQARLYFSR